MSDTENDKNMQYLRSFDDFIGFSVFSIEQLAKIKESILMHISENTVVSSSLLAKYNRASIILSLNEKYSESTNEINKLRLYSVQYGKTALYARKYPKDTEFINIIKELIRKLKKIKEDS